MIYYQDDYCYYFRKPAGIPSSFGKEKSFLDYLIPPYEGGQGGFDTGVSTIAQSLFAFFGKEQELWLLNRLDNETSWLLYFAKNPRVYHQFKSLQSSFQLNKYYLAEVYGDFSTTPLPSSSLPLRSSSSSSLSPDREKNYIQLPIAHHKFNPDRMVVIKQESDIQKTKWTLHHLTTEIVEFQFLPATNTSILLIKIQKGIRHQIRAHLSAIGYPICGDKLYSKSDHKDYPTLQLFSVGVETV